MTKMDEAVKAAMLDAIMKPPFGTDHHGKPYVEIFHAYPVITHDY